MLVIQLSLIVIFSFVLRVVYTYLQNHLELFGDSSMIMKGVMLLMIFNIIIMTGIMLFSAYQTEWRMVGRPGDRGPDGPKGPKGDPICPSNPDGEYCRDDPELDLE